MALTAQCDDLKKEIRAIKTENATEFKDLSDKLNHKIMNLTDEVVKKDKKITMLESKIWSAKRVLEQE